MPQTKILFVAVRQTIVKKFTIFFVACNKELGQKAQYKHPSKFDFQQRYHIALGYLKKRYYSLPTLSGKLDITR